MNDPRRKLLMSRLFDLHAHIDVVLFGSHYYDDAINMYRETGYKFLTGHWGIASQGLLI